MQGINKRTGSLIVGTYEQLTGRAAVSFDGRTGDDGRPTYDHLGGTEIFWNAAKTAETDEHAAIFIDEEGAKVPHDEVEAVTAYTVSPTDEQTLWCDDCVTRHEKSWQRPVGMTEARGRTCASCGCAADAPEPND